MAKTQVLLGVLFCIGVFATVSSDLVPSRQCVEDDSSSESSSSSPAPPSESLNCTVTQLRVTPCPEAAKGDPCKVKRGTTINIEFDFLPEHSAQKVGGRAYWSNAFVDLPLVGMDTNACNYTTCPLEANKPATYKYGLLIADFFPIRAYDVKWKLWSDDMECCFLTKIKLVR